MSRSKEICNHYLNVYNKMAGTNLKLSGRNGYYVIEAVVSDTGACELILLSTLKGCKDFAVAICSLQHLKEREGL